MPTAVVREATDPRDREKCFSIRVDVFCREQKVSRDIEFDGLDAACRHYLATLGTDAVGTARVRPLDSRSVKLERIAVRPDRRRTGIGRLLMIRALDDAVADGYGRAVLHAQAQAGEFYEKLGFVREGGEFMEAGIPHIRMSKDL